MTTTFDPNAAAAAESGVFGLPFSVDEAAVIVVEAPFAATTSYGGGAERGPAAIFEASKQVDLFDIDTGRPYEDGIAWLDDDGGALRALHNEARPLAQQVIEVGGIVDGHTELEHALTRVNVASLRANEIIYQRVKSQIEAKKAVFLVGGDHSTPYGAIAAHAEHYADFGILHIDAHADLRKAFEGFTHSHASIFYNVMNDCGGVQKLVQVGIRDFCDDEFQLIESSNGRIITHFDSALSEAAFAGESWNEICERIVGMLPKNIYVSIDIDGLDPALCPNTGTPVPGGLSFQQLNHLLRVLSKKHVIVGGDVNEVVPGDDEWDANVGARVLYKLIGWSRVSKKSRA